MLRALGNSLLLVPILLAPILLAPILLAPTVAAEEIESAVFSFPVTAEAAQVSEAEAVQQASHTETDSFRVKPYGAFWADVVYATQRTNPGAFTRWVFSPEQHGESAFVVDARRSRFGIDVTGPPVHGLDGSNGGRLEIDFHGDFLLENRAGVQLRHVYWQIENDRWRLLVGQTWDVISPLTPGRLDYAVGYNAGNIGFRRAQFRYERFLPVGDHSRVLLQSSINQDIVSDFVQEADIVGETASWPLLEARCAWEFDPDDDGEPVVALGVSGHVGEVGFDFLESSGPPLFLPPMDDARIPTRSINVDFRMLLTHRLGVQGEFFHGDNLGAMLGGIGQGSCPCQRVPIRSTGGWLDLWFDWSPSLRSYVGYGVDDPLNRDLLTGRVYNQYIYANVAAQLARRWTTGLEVTYWKTHFRETRSGVLPDDELGPQEPGEAVTIDLMLKYSF